MSYVITRYGCSESFDELDKVLQYIEDHVDDEPYDNMLDECYDEIEICGYTYSPSIALYRVDEVAYRCGRSDYYSSIIWDDLNYELSHMYPGESTTWYDFEIEFEEEEEEEDEL